MAKKRVIKFRIKGTAPLLMNCDRYSNPLDPLTKAHKKLHGKRNRTDEEEIALMKSSWLGSLYFNDQQTVCIPSKNIEATLIGGAKKFKKGKLFESGVAVLEDWIPLKHKGPKDIEKLWNQPEFRDVRGVVLDRRRVQKCRPKFNDWSLEFSVAYHGEVVNESDVIQALEQAGEFVGLCDYRPRFGRFECEVIK